MPFTRQVAPGSKSTSQSIASNRLAFFIALNTPRRAPTVRRQKRRDLNASRHLWMNSEVSSPTLRQHHYCERMIAGHTPTPPYPLGPRTVSFKHSPIGSGQVSSLISPPR